MKKKLLFVVLLAAIALFTMACSVEMEYKQPYVTEITVTDLFYTDGYIAGDEIKLDGAKLYVKYSDNKTQTVELTEDMLSGYDMNVPEEGKTVTVTYGGKTTSFCINVYDLTFSSVELASVPNRISYVVGEEIVTDGAVINVRYEGGKTVEVKVTDKMLEQYDNQRVGEQKIYISYYGYKLFFNVTFDAKTVIKMEVAHTPNQNAVFVGMSDKLDLTGLKLRLTYDNDLSPTQDIADEIDNVKVYIDDSSVRTVSAKLAYIPADYPETVTYRFTGAAMVSTGDFVYPDMEIASNLLLDNTRSKTYGRVTSVNGKVITVSTIVEYEVTSPEVEVGQILKSDDVLGKTGAQNVLADGGSGIVLSVGDGKVKMQTAPVATFNINVKDRSFARMEIDKYPVTANYKTDVGEIIQGDKLDLSTGRVRVYYDNGESQVLAMNNALIKVVNSDDDLLRSEIAGLEFTTVDNVTGIAAGRYELKYGVSHQYGDAVSVVVTVVDEKGKSIYVQQNRYVSLEEGLNYTVSISASYNDGGQTKVSECVYYLATQGAGVRQSQLDISAAGKHKLLVYYGGVKDNNVTMIVNVIQRYAVNLEILTETDNINGKTFRKGDTIPVSTLQYIIHYNNGDQSEPTGITMDMLGEDCSLVCSSVTTRKEIYFVIPGTEVKSATLVCKVEAMPIKSIEFDTLPVDTFIQGTPSDELPVDLSGGVLRVFYADGTAKLVGKTGALLNQLRDNSEEGTERIKLSYNPDDTAFLPIADINAGKSYTATLTYFDADGASSSLEFDYYIINPNDAINSIKVVLSSDYYKRNYVQCEDWDLTGVNMIVTYNNNTTSEPLPVTKDMIYDSTTDNIGTDIQVKVRYLGKVDATTFKINVEQRMQTGLSVVKTGRTYFLESEAALDISEYRFSLSYNAGASAEINGLTDLSDRRLDEGWWYEIFDETGKYTTPFKRVGKKIVRLHHTVVVVEGDNSYTHDVTVDFPIEVRENNSAILSIAYEDDSLGVWNNNGTMLNVLERTAYGWELFLTEYDASAGVIVEKYITVYYEDGTVGTIRITNDMVVNYSKEDHSKGYRPVKIRYKDHIAEACVQVLNAEFSKISVEKTPVTNFIVGSELTKNGGIVKCEFEVTDGDNTKWSFYKYLDMNDSAVSCSGFNSNISPDVDHVKQDITLTYKEKTTNYQVIVYNKQPINFKYQNTIFFYGNTKSASATPLQVIAEFDLPSSDEILMWYVSSQYFIDEADFAQYLVTSGLDEQNFMKLICENDEIKYVNRSYLQSAHPVEPLKKGYDRYIVIEVLGNTYYRQENYCLQKYTVIPKVIEVKVVSYTEDAYTLDYTVSGENNLPKTILYLYENLDTIVADYVGKNGITAIELLSPNKEFFRIGVFVNNSFSDESLLDAVFAAIRSAGNEYLQATVVSADVNNKRKGINIGEYNGIAPEYVSYRLAAGETLTLGGVLELLEGNPTIKNYDYSTGVYDIEIGTLRHGEDHYTIDFTGGTYRVTTRAIDSYGFAGWQWDKNEKKLTVTLDDFVTDAIPMYVVHSADKQARIIDEEEFRYYDSDDYSEGSLLAERPTQAGTYYVQAGTDDSFSQNDTGVKIRFTLVIE